MSVGLNNLMWLSAEQKFEFWCHESFKTYIVIFTRKVSVLELWLLVS